MSPRDRLVWIDDFIVIDASVSARDALERIQVAKSPWILISRYQGEDLYAFTADELWAWPALRQSRETLPNWYSSPFEVVLDLHEEFQSTKAESRQQRPADRPIVARGGHVAHDRPLRAARSVLQTTCDRLSASRAPAAARAAAGGDRVGASGGCETG